MRFTFGFTHSSTPVPPVTISPCHPCSPLSPCPPCHPVKPSHPCHPCPPCHHLTLTPLSTLSPLSPLSPLLPCHPSCAFVYVRQHFRLWCYNGIYHAVFIQFMFKLNFNLMQICSCNHLNMRLRFGHKNLATTCFQFYIYFLTYCSR